MLYMVKVYGQDVIIVETVPKGFRQFIEEEKKSRDRQEDPIDERIDQRAPVRYPVICFNFHVPGLQHRVGGELDPDLHDQPSTPAVLGVF